MSAHVSNPSTTGEVKTGEQGVQSQPQLETYLHGMRLSQ